MKPWFLRLLRVVWGIACLAAIGQRLLYPQWHVTTPEGHESTSSMWVMNAPERPFGRDYIEWTPTLLHVAGILAGAVVMWWIITRDLRRAEARERAAAADGSRS